jgi:hypothetical protein
MTRGPRASVTADGGDAQVGFNGPEAGGGWLGCWVRWAAVQGVHGPKLKGRGRRAKERIFTFEKTFKQ